MENDHWKVELKLSVVKGDVEMSVCDVVTETTMKLPIKETMTLALKDLTDTAAKNWQEFDGCSSVKEVSDRLIELGKQRGIHMSKNERHVKTFRKQLNLKGVGDTGLFVGDDDLVYKGMILETHIQNDDSGNPVYVLYDVEVEEGKSLYSMFHAYNDEEKENEQE